MTHDEASFEARFLKRLDNIIARHQAVTDALHQAADASPQKLATLAKEKSDLDPLVGSIFAFKNARAALKAVLQMAEDEPSLREEALTEAEALKAQLPELEQALKIQLLPKDTADARNVIVEIRQGTGGDESALFAADLWAMYARYAENKGWSTQVMSVSKTDLKGIKEVIFSIKGAGVFQHLKFESGVHRIQRVPETEAGGRVHTSAATVAVLPEAEEIDVVIKDEDLRIDTYRASGAGGQHVNKTESAVRITHLPTGLVVQQQDEKSQHRNKARALKILRARLFERQRLEAQQERSSARKSQIGSGDRSQRIRTYNALQGRVTDHRIGLTLHQYEVILSGQIDTFVDALRTQDQAEKLAELGCED